MNRTKIVVPTAFPAPPAPHFDDEATVVSARQVVPIDKARVVERSPMALWICLILFGAAVSGALGALGVNYYENHQRRAVASVPQSEISRQPQNNEPAASQMQSDATSGPESEPPEGGITSATSAASGSEAAQMASQTANQTNDSSVIVASRESNGPSTLIKPDNPASDPGQLVRKRRVHPINQNDGTIPSPEKPAKNKRGAGRIQEIFEGPNPE